MEKTINTTVLALTRLNNSVNGNPRYKIHTLDGEFVSQSDASFVYEISNPRLPAEFELHLTRAGRVWNWTRK